MKIIKDQQRMQEVIERYHIAECFSDITQYEQGMKLVSMPKNTFIFSRPEHRKYLYFLLEGELQVIAISENGYQMLVQHCDSFILIGDLELLGYGNSSNVAWTVSRCLFLAIDTMLLKDKLLSDPVFLRYLCNNLAEKINYFSLKQFENKSITIRQKIVSYILEIGGETGFFKENLRQTSEKLEVSYRHLHRILSELVEEDVLKRRDGGYEISKIGRLEEIFWENEKK